MRLTTTLMIIVFHTVALNDFNVFFPECLVVVVVVVVVVVDVVVVVVVVNVVVVNVVVVVVVVFHINNPLFS